MSSTNKTPNLDLSQWIDTDKPTYLGDHNSDNAKIDAAYGGITATAEDAVTIANSAKASADAAGQAAETAQAAADSAASKATTAEGKADTANQLAATANENANQAASAASTADSKAVNAQTTADGAVSAASTAQTTADGAVSAASTAQTTADGAVSAASTAQTTADDAKATADKALPKALLDLKPVTLPTPTVTYGNGTIPAFTTTNQLGCIADDTFSFFKLYNVFQFVFTGGTAGAAGRVAIDFPNVIPANVRPEADYIITGAGLAIASNSTGIASIFPAQIYVRANGTLSVDCGVYTNATATGMSIRLFACLYIAGNMGDVPESAQTMAMFEGLEVDLPSVIKEEVLNVLSDVDFTSESAIVKSVSNLKAELS